MPEGVQFPTNADIWQPLAPDQRLAAPGCPEHDGVFGRLAPGVTSRRRDAEMIGIAKQARAAVSRTRNKNIDAR